MGNNDDPSGNAIPKLRMTQNTLWTPAAQRYARWKLYVQESYWKAIEGKTKFGKPFIAQPAVMDLQIVWKDKKHGDPESIFGSIADALWENDKFLAGSFDYSYSDTKQASVRVTITINDTEHESIDRNDSRSRKGRAVRSDTARPDYGSVLVC
jgi:hypothetical protein